MSALPFFRQTNVDELALACGPDNRMVGPNGWETRINATNDVEWIPPPNLDTGQARINTYHRPERLLHPPEEPQPHHHNDTEPTAPTSDGPAEPGGPAPPHNHAA